MATIFNLRAGRKLLRKNRGRLVALLMLPAILLGTLPRGVCVCAAELCQSCCQTAAAPAKTGCGNCACCNAASATGTRECCQMPKTSAVGSETDVASVASRHCCHTQTELPSPLTNVRATSLKALQPSPPQFISAAPPVVVAGQSLPTVAWLRPTCPPPFDRVVVLLRLTI
jgi:hypothetical protein